MVGNTALRILGEKDKRYSKEHVYIYVGNSK